MWISILIPTLAFAAFTDALQSGDRCTTPNGESATCISVYSCPVLLSGLRTNDPSARSFVQRSGCGYDYVPLVCCGSTFRLQSPTNSAVRLTSSLLPKEPDCGNQVDNKILNGEATGLEEFPWMALLFYRRRDRRPDSHNCGGALINNRYVLTAAHCVTGEPVRQLGTLRTIRLGEYRTSTAQDCKGTGRYMECNDEPQNIPVEKIISHPNYDSTSRSDKSNDIALIRLSRSVVYTNYIRPICLPTSSAEAIAANQDLWASGWGMTENSSKSDVKLKVSLPVVSNSDCARTYNTQRVSIVGTQLCAGGKKDVDTCQGDSGGPLMGTRQGSASWYLEGIVNFGAACGTEGWPGVYTKVSQYLDWIQANISS